MSGCANTIVPFQHPPIPESLLKECPPLVPSEGSTPRDILENHAQNMEAANLCRLRHNSLLEAVRLRNNLYQQ